MFYDVEKDPKYLSVTEIEWREKLPILVDCVSAAILLLVILANIIAVIAYSSW